MTLQQQHCEPSSDRRNRFWLIIIFSASFLSTVGVGFWLRSQHPFSISFYPLLLHTFVSLSIFYTQLSPAKKFIYQMPYLSRSMQKTALLVTWLVYFISTIASSGQWPSLLSISLVLSIAICAILGKRAKKASENVFSGVDVILFCSIWLFFEAGLSKDLYGWPINGDMQVLAVLSAIGFVLLQYGGHHGKAFFEFRWRLGRKQCLETLGLFCFILIILIPIGLSTGFIRFSTAHLHLFPLAFLALLMVNALPEEILFRGFLQSYLGQWTSQKRALLLTALLFGLTHLNNPPLLDWRWLILASLAGLIYGTAFYLHRNITSAVYLHALTNSLQLCFFESVANA